jgi:DNA-binding MarR family transcriptional regulator
MAGESAVRTTALVNSTIHGGQDIKRVCDELRTIAKLLDKPKPIKIIQQLPENTEKTLKELAEETGIPQSTLHDVLTALWENGLIYRTVDRPIKYGRTKFLGYVLSFGEKIGRRTHKVPPADNILYNRENEM